MYQRYADLAEVMPKPHPETAQMQPCLTDVNHRVATNVDTGKSLILKGCKINRQPPTINYKAVAQPYNTALNAAPEGRDGPVFLFIHATCSFEVCRLTTGSHINTCPFETRNIFSDSNKTNFTHTWEGRKREGKKALIPYPQNLKLLLLPRCHPCQVL